MPWCKKLSSARLEEPGGVGEGHLTWQRDLREEVAQEGGPAAGSG